MLPSELNVSGKIVCGSWLFEKEVKVRLFLCQKLFLFTVLPLDSVGTLLPAIAGPQIGIGAVDKRRLDDIVLLRPHHRDLIGVVVQAALDDKKQQEKISQTNPPIISRQHSNQTCPGVGSAEMLDIHGSAGDMFAISAEGLRQARSGPGWTDHGPSGVGAVWTMIPEP